MRMRRAGWCATGLGLLLATGSCQRGQSLPPPPDFTAGQRAVWQLAPGDAQGGLVIADVGHLLGRLRAAKAVLDTGPETRALLAQGTAVAVSALGFDPLDAEGWRKVGLDPSGPLAFFIGGEKTAQIVFRASDAAMASQTAKTWVARGGSNDRFDCAPAGALYACGSPSWKLAAEPSQSLWPHLESNLPASHRGLELLTYAPLDRGEAQKSFANSAVKGLHAGYFGFTVAPERLVVRGGARVDDAAKLIDYLRPREGAALLGLAQGSIGAGRLTFSPDKLWALVSDVLKPQLAGGGQAFDPVAIVQAATGLDLHKDLVENLTGELAIVAYRSDRRVDKDGRPRSLMDRQSGAIVLGAVDDQRTRHVANRLGELLGGALGSVGELAAQSGTKLAYRSEPGDRPVHWFTVELSGEIAKTAGIERIVAFITSVPGGVAIGVGEDGVDELRKRAGRRPSAFLDELPLPEERQQFERAQMVFWSRVGEGVGTHRNIEAASKALDALRPGTSKVLVELEQLGQLIFDGVASVEVTADRCELFYQVSFL